MKSLVAYENSSDSESEENEEPQAKVHLNGISHRAGTIQPVNSSVAANTEPATSGELFTSLPQPKTHTSDTVEEEQDEFLQKKENVVEKPKKRVKIDVPALADFDSDDDEPVAKKPKQVKASGLFALLPAPKGTPLSNTSFVPNVLQKKTNKPHPNKSLKGQIRNKVKAKNGNETATNISEIAKANSDDDDDIDIPETFDDETWQKVCGKKKPQPPPAAVREDVIYFDPAYNVEAAPEVSKPYDGLDNRAFKELVGSRKRVKENIKLIDIHEDEIRPDREEWLKSLTDPNCEPNTSVKDPVNNTCKVKNHITALAQKALANDKELQMRWAESRFNRKQTQAKYGF